MSLLSMVGRHHCASLCTCHHYAHVIIVNSHMPHCAHAKSVACTISRVPTRTSSCVHQYVHYHTSTKRKTTLQAKLTCCCHARTLGCCTHTRCSYALAVLVHTLLGCGARASSGVSLQACVDACVVRRASARVNAYTGRRS
jgi:hypothetical protein